MKHEYENNIKCPYCNWEDGDSWEFGEDYGTATCGSCSKEFNVTRNVEVTYSTSRIECEDGKHNYQLESYFERTRKYDKGNWNDLPELEWTFSRIEMCSECGDKQYIDITKEEYESKKGGGNE